VGVKKNGRLLPVRNLFGIFTAPPFVHPTNKIPALKIIEDFLKEIALANVFIITRVIFYGHKRTTGRHG
jgi:hypothetical protein